jgi:hypothetical protein
MLNQIGFLGFNKGVLKGVLFVVPFSAPLPVVFLVSRFLLKEIKLKIGRE